MSGLPENLQIKREPSPSAAENKSPNNIKAKLNLHVKRRLQDFNQPVEESVTSSNSKTQVAASDIKQEPLKTETTRQKRPYHKRTDKNKPTQPLDNSSLPSSASEVVTTPQRKYKHKIKQIVANDGQDILTNNCAEENAGVYHNASVTGGTLSVGDDDNDLMAGREKEKCPDVLAMVLSMKKRALMQDPEVQSFLKDVMEVIKS